MFSFNNVNEINAFNNGDGTFCVELYISTEEGDNVTLKIPKAEFSSKIMLGIGMETNLEIELKGLTT